MKKYLSTLAFALAILWCTALEAAPPTTTLLMKTRTVDNSHILLHLANLQQESTVITLTDFTGTTYSRQTITDHNGYAVDLDLNQLPEGRYVLTVTQANQKMKQIIYKNENMLLLSEVKSVSERIKIR